ncbi:MAG: PAS domain S-box protein [Gammaproteobacteria bacterium]|nr:PAS domain-containing protein [Gammaproteobacteria bacterium]MCP5199180.1 PAS domain S-box protein [Gammaproteobacteria bacterium]
MHDKLLLILDREGRIQRFNGACEHLSGYAESEVRGHTCWDFLVPAEDVGRMRGEAFDVLLAGSGRTDIRCYTSTWVARNGARHLIAWKNALVHDDAGALAQVLCVGEVIAPPAAKP